MNGKRYHLAVEQIRPLAEGYGACIATERVTVEGLPVRFMYREAPDDEDDSGWRFRSGTEDDAYMADPDNHGIHDVNTIANFDPSIIVCLGAPAGSAFEKRLDAQEFIALANWVFPGN